MIFFGVDPFLSLSLIHVRSVRAASVKSAFTKAGWNRGVDHAREMEEKWRVEEEEREKQEGGDARRGIDQVMVDMHAYLASIVSCLSSPPSIQSA